MNVYQQGQTVKLRCKITDPDTGQPVDPTSMVISIRSPKGVRTSSAGTKTAPGEYSAIFTPNEDGIWSYRFEGQGARTSVDEGRFFVRRSMVK